MYCKACGFHSFDYLNRCPQCGQNWEAVRKVLGLKGVEQSRGNWFAEIPPQDNASLHAAPAVALENQCNHEPMVEIRELGQKADEMVSVILEADAQEES